MDRECPTWLKGKGALTEKDHQFGSWLRAPTPNLARKTVVKVVGLEEDDINVANQSSTRDSDDKEHGQTERENEMHSVTGLEIHGQVDLDGDPELVIPIMVDLELPITEEVVMHRRINGPDFQEQLDDIDAELTKFDNGKEEGVESGPGQELHEVDHAEAVLGSSIVGFVQLKEGLS
nr:hypothetical protein CFP56_44004 [Quercus suber]